MALNKVIVCLLLCIGLGCNEDRVDCATVSCLGAPSIGLKIISDKADILSEGNYSLEDLSIEGDTAGNTGLSLEPDPYSSLGRILFIQDPDWAEGRYSYRLLIGNGIRLQLKATFIELKAVDSSCCGDVPFLQNLEIDGTSPPMTNGIFIISID